MRRVYHTAGRVSYTSRIERARWAPSLLPALYDTWQSGCVPNQPKTKAYAIRIDDERHRRLIEQAKVEGTNFSETIRNAIDAYLLNPPAAPVQQPPNARPPQADRSAASGE